jgi:hypothetical protein
MPLFPMLAPPAIVRHDPCGGPAFRFLPSVHFLHDSLSLATLHAQGARAGGEVIAAAY